MRTFLLILFGILVHGVQAQQEANKLWYKSPAKAWVEALPIGNGRLGAMVFGDYAHERIQLNEESLWAGAPVNNNNPLAKVNLPAIQKAIFENRLEEAKKLAAASMVGTPPRIRSYQTLGDLYIDYPRYATQPAHYTRELNLHTGEHVTDFKIGGNRVRQRVMASAVSNAILIEITSDSPIDIKLALNRSQDVTAYLQDKDYIGFDGQINDGVSPEQGPDGKHMRFNAILKVIDSDGVYTTSRVDTAAVVAFSNSKRIRMALTSFTDYNLDLLDVDASIDPKEESYKVLRKINKQNFAGCIQQHRKEHSELFERVDIQLAGMYKGHLPTDKRIELFKADKSDIGLPLLFYQYGRYLLMSSSRSPGRLPANLQGIWNKEYQAPWNSDFHTNINLQMNYWPAETGNLPETVNVLNGFMQRIAKPAAVTAQEMYGARGWTLHHLTDPFGRTGVADGVWGISPMNGPWMTLPLYRQFEFNQDVRYLAKEIYPLVKGSVSWILDFLVKSPQGYLVTNPSHSPENAFYYMHDGKKSSSQLTYGATIDNQIIHEVCRNFLEAAHLLNRDHDLVQQVEEVLKQIPPLKIAPNGTIQEWIADYEEVEPGHRHMSHLLGLYPGSSIATKEELAAAQKTIERRLSFGGGHTGWSMAWIINFYARLKDGEKAYENLGNLLAKASLPNLFSTHPPFQIDGNFGGAAGVAEMLLQSHGGEINLLPAIPQAWHTGEVKGLKARGNVRVDMVWKNGKLTSYSLSSAKEQRVRIRYKEEVKELVLKKGVNRFRY